MTQGVNRSRRDQDAFDRSSDRESTPSNQFSAMHVDSWRPARSRGNGSHTSYSQSSYSAPQSSSSYRPAPAPRGRQTPSPSECVPASGWAPPSQYGTSEEGSGSAGRSYSPTRLREYATHTPISSGGNHTRWDGSRGPDRFDDRDSYGRRSYDERGYDDRGYDDDRRQPQDRYDGGEQYRSQSVGEGYAGQYAAYHYYNGNGSVDAQSYRAPVYDHPPPSLPPPPLARGQYPRTGSYVPPHLRQTNDYTANTYSGNNYAPPPVTLNNSYFPPVAPHINPAFAAQGGYRAALPPRPPAGIRAYGSPPPQFRPANTRGKPRTGGSSPTYRGQRASSPTYRNMRDDSPFQDTFELKPPRDEYVAWSCEPIQLATKPVRKLLVLDLNGALVYRSQTRVSHPRPFLSNFLEYLFAADAEERAYDVLVWSSAQPVNVRSMVESNFDRRFIEGVWEPETQAMKTARERRGEGRLLDVWARDKMNLGTGAYYKKVQTVKDLRQVAEPFGFTEETTVLLDDSPLKAMHQPWSQIIIPEYDRPEHDAAHSAATALKRQKSQADGSSERGMDNVLLGVIGILEAMRNVASVPAWVRSGHINDPSHLDETPKSAAITMADLPTHESFVPWFKDPSIHTYWVKRGVEALARRSIPVEHGIFPIGGQREGPGSKKAAKKVEAPKGKKYLATPPPEEEGQPRRPQRLQRLSSAYEPLRKDYAYPHSSVVEHRAYSPSDVAAERVVTPTPEEEREERVYSPSAPVL